MPRVTRAGKHSRTLFMSDWPHAKIRSTALAYIGKHAMDPGTWRYTLIGGAHPEVAFRIRLEYGETSLVSFWLGHESWYLLSTRRVIGCYAGKCIDAAALDVREDHFGDFKGVRGVELELMKFRLITAGDVTLQYETGRASMAPIYYFRYWWTKYPILSKLRE